MYRILKYPHEERHKHFWSSDWHNYHDPKWPIPIWEMRGYLSVQDSAERVIQKVNERVGEDDTLWYLGDAFLNTTDEQVLQWLSAIKCKNIKYLFGNHESSPYRLYKQEVLKQYGLSNVEVYPIKMGNVEFLGNHCEIHIGKRNIVMNHFPIHSWNGMGGRKSWNLSGHSHNQDKTRNPDAPINRCLDCSWDWKKDVWSYEEIEDIMSTKTFVSYDHHKTDVY